VVDLRPVLDEILQATGVDERTLVELVERAVADTYARVCSDAQGVVAHFDMGARTISLQRTDETGAVVPVPLPADVVRQSGQAVKAAVAGLLRDQERGRVLREGSARRGELVDAIVERQDGATWYLRVNGMEAVLRPEEQIPGEVLERNRHLKVFALDARRRGRDAVIDVSRSHPNLLRRLLEQEVPEMSTGQVVVRALVREPGRRSKVAVEAPVGGIDPEGACIGPRGVRIRAVVSELGDEQVHVVGWSDDPATYVARAVGPAAVLGVELDYETRTAHVTVPEQQLSLAIGRGGENARLAHRLTGWRIDIRGDGGSA
jgi:transcription termination/antitermination protein NusA